MSERMAGDGFGFAGFGFSNSRKVAAVRRLVTLLGRLLGERLGVAR